MIHKNFRNLFPLVFLLALFALNPPAVPAAGGQLDPTFSGDGKLILNFNDANDTANKVVIQPNGKIVVAGTSSGPTTLAAVARYNANGTVDLTFSGDGRVTTGIVNSLVNLRALLVQPDGKLVVAGFASFTSLRMILIRYNSNGSLDTTFGGDGIVETNFSDVPNTNSLITDLAIQTDGKLVAVGRASNSTNTIQDWAIVRYNSEDGSLDTTFGSGGKVSVDFGGNANESAQAVVILPNGKILVGGYGNPGGEDFGLALLTTNGSLDTNFDGDGKVTTDFNNSNDRIFDIKVQPDGKIVAAGQTGTAGSLNFALARYNSNGSLDTSFDTDGKVETNINPTGNDAVNEIALSANGKIVAVGDNGNVDFTLARYNANGGLDSSFGQAGKLFTDIFTNSPDTAGSVALQPDGRIVVAGTTTNPNGTDSDFAVARYLPNSGSPFDFDGDGKTDVSIFRPSSGQWWYFRSGDAVTQAVAFGNGGDLITPGDFTGDGKTDVALFRPANGSWYILRSEDGSFFSVPFGASGDVPVPADYDGDGKTDAAVFRPSDSTWYIRRSSDLGTSIVTFGISTDKPVPADYDGDGKADIAIFRPADGSWWYLRSIDLQYRVFRFGLSTDKPVQGDYSGDGKADIAVFRESTGEWFFQRSEDNSYYSVPFGTVGDIPTPGDYDGDGKFDTAVFRPATANWFVQRSTAGIMITSFGASGDRPIPNAFVP